MSSGSVVVSVETSTPTIRSFDELRLWECLNAYGEIRRRNVVGRFDLNDPDDQEKICRCYIDWLVDNNYILLECESDGKKTYIVKKCSKRGNDVDMRYVEKRLRHVATNIEPYAHYDSTRALKIVVTVNPERFNDDIESAWMELGREFNRFVSVLKRRYGDVSVLRSWESHSSGYPHIHAVVCFESKRWLVVGRLPDKNGHEQWRIPTAMSREIASGWGLGFLDVQAVVPDSIDEDIEDSVWYLIKSRREGDYRDVETWSKKRLLTMAITWYLGLRTWSSSRKLCRRPDLIRDSKIIQTDIEGNDLFDCTTRPKFKFVGMVRGRDIDL